MTDRQIFFVGERSMDLNKYRIEAIATARAIMANDPVFIDTETTGLGSDAEVCDIAVVNSAGETVLSTLIRPNRPIPAEATAIHGITNAMVEREPLFDEVWPLLKVLFCRHPVVTYNAAYDSRLIRQSYDAWFDGFLFPSAITYKCAMLLFAQYYGDWNDYKKSFKWQKLDVAAKCAGYPAWSAHRALGDTLATRAVMLWLAGQGV
jgi:DNA polymerase-3 subunit epsilon